MSELKDREAEIRAAAADMETVLELARHFRWPMESARAANELHNLGLTDIRLNRFGAPRAGQAVPKPNGKAKRPAEKGAGE